MFKKLLANLPFNPSLINQVAFYAKRLHRESYVRTVGLIVIVLAMAIQVFAVVSPPQKSLALSQNDLIPGGFTNLWSAVDHCNKNDFNYRDILAYYQISCENLSRSQTVTIRSTDYNRQLYSMGRIAYGKAGEYPVTINDKTYFMRYLWSWDSGIPYSSYKALSGIKGDGTQFFILFGCGNIVIIGKPAPPPQQINTDVCPQIPGIQTDTNQCKPCEKSKNSDDKSACLILHKKAENITKQIKNADGTLANPGDVIQYTLSVKNTGQYSVSGFIVEENLTDVLEYATIVDKHGGTLGSDNIMRWPKTDIASQATIYKMITVKVKNPLPDTPVSASNQASYDLVMNNVYGDAVNIRLPKSTLKTTEQVVTTLPNTGPGTTLLVGFGFVAILSYFLARNYLMAKELDIAKDGLDTERVF